MTSLVLLLVLLGAAYVGSVILGDRHGRGLASGSGWLVLGFVAGPAGLAVLDDELLAAFRQISLVAVGWVAVAVGLEYGYVGARRVRWSALVLGNLGAIATAAAVAAAAGAALAWAEPGAGFLARREHLVVALGAAAALSDTARGAFRWTLRSATPEGSFRRLLAELADADDLVPVLLAVAAFAIAPDASPALPTPALRIGAELGLGLALGAIAAMLVATTFRRTAVLAVLLGTSVVALGLAARLGLSGVGAGFALGLLLHLASRHGAELRELSLHVERSVLVPALLLAGASVQSASDPRLLALAGAAVAARLLGKVAVGGLLCAVSPVARRGGWTTAPAMAAASPLGPIVALAFALRFPGTTGQAVLACAFGSALAGELVSAPAVRAALRRAGELDVGDEPEPAADGARLEADA